MPGGVSLVDSTGTIAYLSHVLPGITRSQLIGTNVFQYFTDSSERQRYAQALACAYWAGDPQDVIMRPRVGDSQFCQRYRIERVRDMLAIAWQSHSPVEFSRREQQVLDLICEGYSAGEIAARLGVSTSTFESYRKAVLHKTGTSSTAQLVRWAIRYGRIEP